MLLVSSALILLGFVLLVWSADLLVDNASIVAKHLNISTFIVGVIIVGFGTSAPEMFVSGVAALQDKGNLALGNALGSNITNIGLVLGSAALVRLLPVHDHTSKIDIPLVIVAGFIAIAVVVDGVLSKWDGLLLLLLLAFYLYWCARHSNGVEPIQANLDAPIERHRLDPELVEHPRGKTTVTASCLTILSILLLVLASKMLVKGAVDIATHFNVNELLIGITVIAIGTSLPELAAAVAAARKGAHQMILGNVIGSNIFNTLGVLGITGVIRTTEIDTMALYRDFPIMCVFTITMFIFARTKQSFSRREGGILLSAYLLYICYLIFTAVG